MQEHQKRVIAEHQEVVTKVQALAKFIQGPIFPTVHAEERARLVEQHHVMDRLSEILAERIKFFESQETS